MPRFFIDEYQVNGNNIVLDEENSNHLAKVLRSKIGDLVTVCDKKETDYNCKISEISKKEVTLEIIEKVKNETEPNYKITLFQSLPKQSKMELIIEKCVEIGVSEITPIETKFCVAKKNDKSEQKISRWQKISETAAKQCNRGIIPKINEVIDIKDLKNEVEKFDLFIVAYEKEKELTIKNLLKEVKKDEVKNIGIIIGSEGGFDVDEIEMLKSLGIKSVSLTDRILRTETASFFLSTILLYELEA